MISVYTLYMSQKDLRAHRYARGRMRGVTKIPKNCSGVTNLQVARRYPNLNAFHPSSGPEYRR